MFARLHTLFPRLSGKAPVLISGVLLCAPYVALLWWLCHTQRLASIAAYLSKGKP